MNINKDTWHYRNFEIWLNSSSSSKARNYRYREVWDPKTAAWVEKEPTPVSLCPYVRIVLFWSLLHRGQSLFARLDDRYEWFVPAFVASCVWLFIAVLFTFTTTFPVVVSAILAPLVFFASVAALVGGAMLVSLSWELLRDYRARRRARARQQEEPEEKPLDIFREYYHAKHEKICPLLTFVDKETENANS